MDSDVVHIYAHVILKAYTSCGGSESSHGTIPVYGRWMDDVCGLKFVRTTMSSDVLEWQYRVIDDKKYQHAKLRHGF